MANDCDVNVGVSAPQSQYENQKREVWFRQEGRYYDDGLPWILICEVC
jgi:hypothetical protein